MKYLAGVIKDARSVMALCEPGSLEGPIDDISAYLRDDVLSGLALLRHQRAVVPRLILLEAAPTNRTNGAVVTSNMMCYCDNFGTGKTRTMLAMIAIAPLPLACVPQTLISTTPDGEPVRVIIKNMRAGGRMTSNMVVVKSDVIGSWCAEIALLPELRMIKITNVFDYNEFARVATSPGGIGKINSFDIILVKFGDMTLGGKNVPIVNTVAALLRDLRVVLSRVIMDDYEQWHRASESIMPDASSYIAVSTTAREMSRTRHTQPAATFADVMAALRPRANDLARSRAIDERRLRSCDEFIRESVNMPALYRWIVNCEDHKGVIAELFGGTADPETARALEALNGDAVKTTARLLNISATTPADIYAALMQGKETAVIRAKARVERCSRLKAHIVAVFRAMTNKTVDTITSVEIDAIGNWINGDAADPPAHIKPRMGIMAVIDKYAAEAADAETAALREINIVREMLARCACEMCRESVGADPARETSRDGIIMQCCGKIVCRECFARDARGKLRCPLNARHKVGTSRIVFLSGKIDFAAVVEAAPDSAATLVKFEVEGGPAADAPFADINNMKMRALMCIIHGAPIQDRKPDPEELPRGVIIGTEHRACDAPRKVIVFARELETIGNIQEMLEARNINYAVLSGSHSEVQGKINAFRDDPEMRVLLMQSERHASGINLQFATDLVFYHRLTDREIYRQATGRIQRFGRTCSGTIWRLQYEGERAG